MGKRNYKVIVKSNMNEYCVGRISGIISALVYDNKNILSINEKAEKDKIVINGQDVLAIDIYTNKSTWDKIRSTINNYYPNMCAFIEVYDTWLKKIESN